jgi:hypothetical protein
MSIDPANPVVALCAAGMECEVAGRLDEARALFLQAWEARGDDLDASIAAHYVARRAADPTEALRWNALAVQHADALTDDRGRDLFASLHLNLSHSYEVLGQLAEARAHAHLAARHLESLPAGGYRDFTARGIAALHERLGMPAPSA